MLAHVFSRSLVGCALALAAAACGERAAHPGTPHAGAIHLADRLDLATAATASAPAAARERRAWSFEEPRDDWRYVGATTGQLAQHEGAVQLDLSGAGAFRVGGLQTDLEGVRFADWETVVVQARTSGRFAGVTVACNLGEGVGMPSPDSFFMAADATLPVFNDGSTQSYAIPLRAPASAKPTDECSNVAVLFAALGPADVDILSIELVPRGAAFIEDFGARHVSRAGGTYYSLFAHAPATLHFPVENTEGGRFAFALTADRDGELTYRVGVEREGEHTLLFEETVSDAMRWQSRSVDLPAGAFDLVLEAEAATDGTVALWGAPIVTATIPAGERALPNVVFYVIDGGGADLMSLYEYGRPTTPFLEELAKEGVLFTRAHSNSTWTQPSTVSFMTGLHHSVFGGLRRGAHSSSVPHGVLTMAEHMRGAGFATASLTANPNAGRMIGTQRGVDWMRDLATEHHSTSSVELHEHFFEFRDAYAGAPRWVHFQTTDVHEPNEPHEPFAGRFVPADEADRQRDRERKMWMVAGQHFGSTSVAGFYDMALAKAEIDRKAFFGTRRGLYDETMLHQDHALEEFVQRLKAEGEWENTLFILGSDHGHPAGTFARFGRGEIEPQPEPWQGALFDAYATRVPLLVIWPGHIEGGRRFDEPVSMIDVLPTLLDLLELPAPEVCQGHSLAPLLRGEEMEVAPVMFDEFRVDEATGELVGNLEIVHGPWGASLEIGPQPKGSDPTRGRHSVPAGGRWGAVHPYFADVPRLLLYDLADDPFALHAVNDEHPELVERYTEILLERWEAHRALAQRFEGAEGDAISPEQLEQLRALGYIR